MAAIEDIVKSMKDAHPDWCDDAYTVTQEENENLCQRIQAGDKSAETELICKNMRLALAMSKKYYKGDYEEDAFLGALLQLIVAAKRYNSEIASFSTYAVQWIRQFIMRDIYDLENTIRLPAHALVSLRRVQKYLAQNERGWNDSRQLTIEDIMEIGQVSEEIAENIKMYLSRPLTSLDKEVLTDNGSNDSCSTIGEFISDETVNIEKTVIDAIFSEDVGKIMQNCLNEKELTVIHKRFGLNGEKRCTLEEISKTFDPPVTRERIRQIEVKALKKLRRNRDMRRCSIDCLR